MAIMEHKNSREIATDMKTLFLPLYLVRNFFMYNSVFMKYAVFPQAECTVWPAAQVYTCTS